MKYWYDWFYGNKLDQSIILYSVWSGEVLGGSNPIRSSNKFKPVKQVQEDTDGFRPGGDYTMELDLSNRSLVMWINNEKIILDGSIGDFQFSPIVILNKKPLEVTIL